MSIVHCYIDTLVVQGTCSPLQRYKAYAMHKDTYNLFVLFTSTTPTFALR